MAKKSHHVVPAPNGGWNVRKGGSERASKHFDNKKEAEEWARDVSRNQHSELVIHKRDGTIQRKDSHGNDPLPPKDER
jgi:hypothetical protein